MHGSCFVRISRAIVDMEIIPAAISRKLGGGFVACTNCRAQTLDVVLGCSPQRIRRQFDEGIEPCGKAPADLLMNTEDDGDSRAYRQAVPPRISRTPHVSTKSLYRSLLRNIGSGIHSESFFQLPSSNGEYGSRAA